MIVFWQVFLPSLLKDHMQHLADPSALRTFPFETELPDGPTHHLVALEETLNHGPIVRFLHGDDHHAVTGRPTLLFGPVTWPSPSDPIIISCFELSARRSLGIEKKSGHSTDPT